MEFGLFKGYSFWYTQRMVRELKRNSMRLFGFDSFAGLPEPQGIGDGAPADQMDERRRNGP